MRWVLAIALFLLAGCQGGGLSVTLETTAYSIREGSPVFCCAADGNSYRPLECPDGRVHGMSINARGATAAQVEADAWRLIWDDGHRTGVSVADGGDVPGEPGLTVTRTLACAPAGTTQIVTVELQDSSGKVIGRTRDVPRPD